MKKGFVVSAVLYPLLVIALALIMSVIAMSDNRRKILDNLKLEVTEESEADPEMSNSTLYYKMLALEEAYAELNARVSEERFEEIEEKIKAAKLESFPVGSIFVSTTNKNPSTLIGGTWERYGKGRALVGVNEDDTTFSTVNKEIGHKELQAHTHTIGTHNHSFSATTSTIPNHRHTVNGTWSGGSGGSVGAYTHHANRVASTTKPIAQDAGAHNHTVSGTTALGGGGNTGSTGTGNAGNIQPSITVYFWKRTA